MKTRLKELTEEHQQQIEQAVDFIVNSVYADLAEALGADMDNESLIETVADHLYDYPDLYRHASWAKLTPEAHAAWLAVDWGKRRKWLLSEFQYA